MRLALFLAALVTVAGCDSVDPLAPVAPGDVVASEAELLAARAAWQAARPAFYRYTYRLVCEECPNGDRVGVRDGRVVETTFRDAESVQTLDDLFETARRAFEVGYTGEVRLSQAAPRFPVVVRVGRIRVPGEPLTSDIGLGVTVTGFEAE